MKWINQNERLPEFNTKDSMGFKYEETAKVFLKILLTNGILVRTNGVFTKSRGQLKVNYTHYIGGTHQNDFTGYSHRSIQPEHIKEVQWLDEN